MTPRENHFLQSKPSKNPLKDFFPQLEHGWDIYLWNSDADEQANIGWSKLQRKTPWIQLEHCLLKMIFFFLFLTWYTSESMISYNGYIICSLEIRFKKELLITNLKRKLWLSTELAYFFPGIQFLGFFIYLLYIFYLSLYSLIIYF